MRRSIQTLLEIACDALSHNHLVENVQNGRSLLRFDTQHFADQISQRLRVHRIDWRVGTSQDLHRQTVNALGVKSVPQIAHFVQDAAQSPNITFIRIVLGFEKFGAHVVWGSDAGICKVFRTIQHLCNAKISKPYLVEIKI